MSLDHPRTQKYGTAKYWLTKHGFADQLDFNSLFINSDLDPPGLNCIDAVSPIVKGLIMRRERRSIKGLVSRWQQAEEGVAATEYAILLALIIIGSIGIIGTIGSKFAVLYAIIANSLPEGFM